MSKLYYSIGEVSAMLGEAPSVLRFWESEFDCLKPVKNKRGVRSYTAHDIDLLKRIQYLTRQCGYTLDGVREQLRTRSIDDPRQEVIDNLNELRRTLVQFKDLL